MADYAFIFGISGKAAYYTPWASGQNYTAGDTVKDGGKGWKCKTGQGHLSSNSNRPGTPGGVARWQRDGNVKDLAITDNDESIIFDGVTYEADDTLIGIGNVDDVAGAIPQVSFSVICDLGTTQYQFFSSDPGPVECELQFLAYGTSWESKWRFIGILSRGTMVKYRYDGIIEHVISWKMRTRKPLMWNNSTQKSRYASDNGLEYIHEIDDIRNSIAWEGSNA